MTHTAEIFDMWEEAGLGLSSQSGFLFLFLQYNHDDDRR